ncbi:MAG: NAD(P)H-dependent oxidoreductase subunit E [Gammaproteobacteria bacterium]|nr:NAD(P)H-dependent oxidoreductase subunit E [Gammaproteobacteria bacterium]MBT8105899.1 NAD(P)H-dependent oxidoreductase subunit E [Gammaproteobacteria bacterium]NNF48823.1 hypothetical protein [Woeseiaceae bacterium]NNK25913.1 hypothetical protein [Woeseiaceae bacterium]NNL64214.1 hypothetical protein [Woeseiaceae bacterium]
MSVRKIAQRYDNRAEMLVQVLVALVQQNGWISEDDIRELADALNLSRADVHGVVEYYHDFRTEPPGSHIVKLCRAEACQAMGGRELAAHAEEVAGGDTTLEAVYCLGNCACAPAVMIDGKTYGRVDAERLDALLASLAEAAS